MNVLQQAAARYAGGHKTGDVTVAKVNAALKAVGATERLRRGKGYYYFCGGEAAMWFTSGVYVSHVSAFTLDGWVAEWKRMGGKPT